jgi:hypothetical protein
MRTLEVGLAPESLGVYISYEALVSVSSLSESPSIIHSPRDPRVGYYLRLTAESGQSNTTRLAAASQDECGTENKPPSNFTVFLAWSETLPQRCLPSRLNARRLLFAQRLVALASLVLLTYTLRRAYRGRFPAQSRRQRVTALSRSGTRRAQYRCGEEVTGRRGVVLAAARALELQRRSAPRDAGSPLRAQKRASAASRTPRLPR